MADKVTTMTSDQSHNASKNIHKGPIANFVLAGLSGMGATLMVQPLDLIKNRLQLQTTSLVSSELNSIQIALSVIQKEGGIFGLYNGLSAGLLRQATYTTSRLGVYNSLMEYYSQNSSMPFYKKALVGMIAGGVGALVGNPAEIALVRMTADGKLHIHQQRHYRHVFDALKRIVHEEGPLTLWRGCSPTVARAMILNAAQLATYSQSKQILMHTGYFQDNLSCHVIASLCSGLVATAVSIPVDITKTRIQNMKIVNGVPEYRGAIDCLFKILKYEGVFMLWKGSIPYFLRLGPHTVLTFVLLEQLNSIYKKFYPS
jgi:solute carrier family 25 oxoglutarate transporter 11